MSDDVINLGDEDEDEWDVAGMSVGEYRRLHEQIEAEGRESLSEEDLERYDAAEAEMRAIGDRLRDTVRKHYGVTYPKVNLDKLLPKRNFGDLYESLARNEMYTARDLGRDVLNSIDGQEERWKAMLGDSLNVSPLERSEDSSARLAEHSPSLSVPKIDTEATDALVDATAETHRQEAQEREAAAEDRRAQLEELVKVVGSMEAMLAEQQETTSSVDGLREDGERSGKWNVASVILAFFAALFAGLGLFLGK